VAPAAIVFGTLLRLAIAAWEPEIADINNAHRVADVLRAGGTLYVDTKGLFPYPPVWNRVEVAAAALSDGGQMGFAFWIKLPSILADAAIAILLMLLVPGGRGGWLATAYALNPVPILISAGHGQFDAVAILGCVAALYFLQRRPHAVASGLCLGAGIALKSFPVLLLPVFWPFVPARQRLRFAAAAVLPTALLLSTYLLFVPAAVVREVFGYSGASDHGWAAIVRGIAALRTRNPFLDLAGPLGVAKVVFLALYLVALWRWSREPVPTEPLAWRIAVVFVAFYVVYGGIGSQYLLWAVPFLLLVSLPAGLLYSAAAVCSLVPFYRLFYSGVVLADPIYRPERLGPRFAAWLVGTSIWWLFCAGWLLRSVLFRGSERRSEELPAGSAAGVSSPATNPS
jgi:hypothetical protein